MAQPGSTARSTLVLPRHSARRLRRRHGRHDESSTQDTTRAGCRAVRLRRHLRCRRLPCGAFTNAHVTPRSRPRNLEPSRSWIAASASSRALNSMSAYPCTPPPALLPWLRRFCGGAPHVPCRLQQRRCTPRYRACCAVREAARSRQHPRPHSLCCSAHQCCRNARKVIAKARPSQAQAFRSRAHALCAWPSSPQSVEAQREKGVFVGRALT